MKILLVNGNAFDGTIGGTQSFTESLAVCLADRGHEVLVLCHGVAEDRVIRERIQLRRILPPSVHPTRFPKMARFCNQLLAIHNPFIGMRVKRAIGEFRPDVAHLQMLRRLTPSIVAVLRRANTPIVQTVHETFSLWDFNAFDPEDTPGKLYSKPGWIVRLLQSLHRFISRKVQIVTAPSHFVLDEYLSRGYFRGVPAQLIPNGVPLVIQGSRAEADSRGESELLHLLFLGRLDHHKGVLDLLQAMSLVACDVRLIIAGEGILSGEVERAAALDPRIEFVGAVTGARRIDLFVWADALICPSTGPEAFGLVVIEAYSFGLPVISTTSGGLGEVVTSDSTIVVSPRSPSAIADAIAVLGDKSRRAIMSEAARERAKEFNIIAMVERFESIYEYALSR